MNRALCSNIGHGAFPSPENLVEAGLNRLQTECGLGYRAKSLLQLAQQVNVSELHQHCDVGPSHPHASACACAPPRVPCC